MYLSCKGFPKLISFFWQVANLNSLTASTLSRESSNSLNNAGIDNAAKTNPNEQTKLPQSPDDFTPDPDLPAGDLLFGDMVLTPDQRLDFHLINGLKENVKNSKIGSVLALERRRTKKDKSHRWPDATIPYEYSKEFDAADIQIVSKVGKHLKFKHSSKQNRSACKT